MSERLSFWKRLGQGLSRTRNKINGSLSNIMAGKLDQAALDELEETLITSDIGIYTSNRLIERLKARRGEARDLLQLEEILRQEMLAILQVPQPAMADDSIKPLVIMVVGVNGVGKTTSIGKLAWLYKNQGNKVLLGAGDTFRAAASEQLCQWGERAGCQVVWEKSGADPSGVAFSAVSKALEEDFDVLILDTAGRLHTKLNLMEELKKIHRVMGKRLPGAPHQVFLVLDATTGQNALNQARLFHQATPLSGLILTKLDSSAKGGVVFGLCGELKLPICYIGQGEAMDDLKAFDANEFVRAIV